MKHVIGASLFVSLFFLPHGVLAQTVVTATSLSGSFVFVFDEGSAVLKCKSAIVPPVHCTFREKTEGIDDSAHPYVSSQFDCESNIALLLVQEKDTKKSALVIFSDKKVLAKEEVDIDIKNY